MRKTSILKTIILLFACSFLFTLSFGCASANAKDSPSAVQHAAKGKKKKCNECMKKVRDLKELQKEIKRTQARR